MAARGEGRPRGGGAKKLTELSKMAALNLNGWSQHGYGVMMMMMMVVIVVMVMVMVTITIN
eukprot:2949094-Lingulodinium_polyedra.AAC.1